MSLTPQVVHIDREVDAATNCVYYLTLKQLLLVRLNAAQ